MTLPGRWPSVPLSEVCAQVDKRDPVTTGRAGIRYVDIGSVDGQRQIIDNVADIIATEAPSRCRQVLREGDTVFSTVRPYLRKIGYVDRSLDGEFASTGFAVLRPGPQVHPRFLHYYLVSDLMMDQVLPFQKGVSYPAVLDREVRACRFPLPPLEEQRRIVDILDDHLSRLDAALDTLLIANLRTKSLVQSTLTTGFQGLLVEDDHSEGTAYDLLGASYKRSVGTASQSEQPWPLPRSWVWVRIGDLFEVSVGTTPRRSDESLWGGDLPWVSSGEVAFGHISRTRETVNRGAVSSSRIHPPGTVLLAMIGEGKTRGQAAIVDVEFTHNQNCASIHVPETRILPEYIFHYLRARYLETRRDGSGGNQPALNKKSVREISVPLAPLGTQRKLVERFSWLVDSTERVQTSVDNEIRRSRAMRSALLSAAFSGQLTARRESTEEVA